MIKNIVKDSFTYGILNAFNKFFIFFIFFIFVKYFQKEDIAILDMLIIFSTMVSVFVSMQFESSFARFYFNEKEEGKHFDLMKTIAFMMCLSAIVYLLPSYYIFNSLFLEYQWEEGFYIFIMIILIGIFYNINNLVNLHFRYNYEKKNFIIASLLFPVVYLCIIGLYVLFYSDLNFSIIFLSQIIAYIGSLFFQFSVMGNDFIKSRFQYKKIKEIFKYSLPMFPMFFLIIANDKAIIYILKEFIPLESLADFSIATKFLAFLSLFFFALRMALDPKINNFISFPSKERANEYISYLNIYIVISLILFIFFIIAIPYVQEIFFTEYINASKWASILALSFVMLNFASYMTPGFSIKKRMDIRLVIVFFQVLFNFIGFYLVLKSGYNVIIALNYLVLVNYIFILVQHYFSNKLYFISNEYLKSTGVFLLLFLIVNKGLLYE
jgi:O-antigen/teichoic acid export membrane protein